MKILFVNIGMNMFRGGGENFDINLSQHLRIKGFETELYTLQPIFGDTNFTKPSNSFDEIHMIRSPWLYPITSFLHRYRLLRFIRYLRGMPRIIGQIIFELIVIYRLIKRQKEDLVIITCCLPLITSFSNIFLKRKAFVRMPGPINNYYDKLFCLNSTGIIANGDAYNQISLDKNIINLYYLEIGVMKYKLIDNDERNFIREKLGLVNGGLLALYVGRLIAIKDLSLIIKSWYEFTSKYKDSLLLIAGDGPEMDRLRILSANLFLSDKIKFLGYTSKKELANLYQCSDCLLLSSFYDNFPNVLLESLSLGTPCISTNVGGVPLIIEHNKNGYLVQDRDPIVFANHIIKFSKERHLFNRNIIREDTLEKFNWDKTASSFLKILSYCE
tara:strand:- start:19929 stop:21086 length:1158 start_codon:yes stop_codon:yes gene_type:complete